MKRTSNNTFWSFCRLTHKFAKTFFRDKNVIADYPKGWPQPTESLATWENWPVEPYEQQKRRSFAGVYLASAKPRKLACRADSPAFSCVANLLVGNGQTFG